MKRYQVIIEASAQKDIEISYHWGSRRWSIAQANKWLRELRGAIRQLSVLPESRPIAPEDDEFTETIRQLIIGRYRVLFTVQGKKVHILHVRGAYFDEETEEEKP
jgi:plasmid stabilization system protein ParE